MTTEQIIKEVRALDSELEAANELWKEAKEVALDVATTYWAISAKKTAMTQLLAKESPFKVGDKVRVAKAHYSGGFHGKWTAEDGIVSSVNCWLRKDNSIEHEYKINKIKKNGEMSMKSLRYKTDSYQASEITSLN